MHIVTVFAFALALAVAPAVAQDSGTTPTLAPTPTAVEVDLGPVELVAGSLTPLQLNGPRGIAFDSIGNLYVAQNEGNRVDRISAADGRQTLAVALPSVVWALPDPRDDLTLYCAQYGVNRIAAVNLSDTTSITTVTSDGLNEPTGIDFYRPTSTLFIANHGAGRVRSVPAAGGASTVVGGVFSLPRAAIISHQDDVVFVTTERAIYHMTIDGTNATIVADSAPRSGSSSGTASEVESMSPHFGALSPDSQHLFFSDTNNNKVRRMHTTTYQVVTVYNAAGAELRGGSYSSYATSLEAQLNKPYGVALHPTGGALYVAGFHAVMRIVLVPSPVDLGPVKLVAGARTAGDAHRPSGIAFDSMGNLYIPQYPVSRIDRITAAGGGEIVQTLQSVMQIVVDPRDDSVLYCTQLDIGRIARLNLMETASAPGGIVASDLSFPYGMAFYRETNTLYFANRNEGRIRAVPPSVGATSAPVGAALSQPTGVAIQHRHAALFIAAANQIFRVLIDGTATTAVAGNVNGGGSGRDGLGTFADFSAVQCALSPNEAYLFFSDFSRNRLRRMNTATYEVVKVFNPSGAELASGNYESSYPTSLAARLNLPSGLAFHPSGDALYVAGDHAIMRIALNESLLPTVSPPVDLGPVQLVAGDRLSGVLANPRGMAFDALGNLYVAQFGGGGRINRITAEGHHRREPVVSLTEAIDVTLDPRDKSTLYCTQYGVSRLVFVNLTAATLLATEVTTSGLNRPYGIDFDRGSNTLYLTNRGEGRIRAVPADDHGASSTRVGDALGDPRGVAVEHQKAALLVTTEGRIFRVALGSTTLVIAGRGATGDRDGVGVSAAMNQMALAALSPNEQHLYFCDSGNRKVRRMHTTTYEVVTVFNAGGVELLSGPYAASYPTSLVAQLNNPLGVAFAPTGDALYVSGYHAVMRIELNQSDAVSRTQPRTRTQSLPSATRSFSRADSRTRSRSGTASSTVATPADDDTHAPRRPGSESVTARLPPACASAAHSCPLEQTRTPQRTVPVILGDDDATATKTRTKTVLPPDDDTSHVASSLRPADARVRALGLSPTAAEAITATVYGSSAVAAAISPTMGSKATSAGRVARAAACGAYASELGDEDAWPEPVTFLWLVFPIRTAATTEADGGSVTEGEADALARGVGAVVASTGLNAATALLLVYLVTQRRRQETGAGKALVWYEHAAVAGYTVAATYLAPSVTSVAVTLLRYAPGAGAVLLWVAGTAGIGLCALAAAPLVRLLTAVRVFTARHAEDDRAKDNVPPAHDDGILAVWKHVFASTWDGVRDPTLASHRWCVLEDLAAAHAIAALEGARPSTIAGCRAVGGGMVLVALLHVAYLGVVRPYAATLERIGMLGLAVLQCAMAVVAATVLFTSSTEESSATGDAGPDVALALLQLTYDGAVFFVAGLLAVVAWREYSREPPKESDTVHDTTSQAPLLSKPPVLATGPERPEPGHVAVKASGTGDNAQSPHGRSAWGGNRQENPLRAVEL